MPSKLSHFKTPFQRDPVTGKVAVVEQGTQQHIESQELGVAMCPVGFRQERPDFGWPWPLGHTAPLDPQPLVDALNRLVPAVPNRTASEYADLAADVTGAARVIEVDSPIVQGAS